MVATDLSRPGFLDDIRQMIDALDVGQAISNAGAGAMGAMLKVDVEDLSQKLSLNTQAHLRLSHHFGQRLGTAGQGGILLLGSTAGMQGNPEGDRRRLLHGELPGSLDVALLADQLALQTLGLLAQSVSRMMATP